MNELIHVLNGLLAKYLCLPGLAQETYSTIPVGAINRVDNEGSTERIAKAIVNPDRDPSNRTGTQHLPYTLREKTTKWFSL